jgi:hypothetical protein
MILRLLVGKEVISVADACKITRLTAMTAAAG